MSRSSAGGEDNVRTPGDPLAVIEEYFPGEGTYVDEERGLVRASKVGRPLYDYANRVVRVTGRPFRYSVPRPGSVVLAYVGSVRPELAVLTIVGEYDKGGNLRRISWPLTGMLHISQASQEYLKNLFEAYAVGDLIKARVLSEENPYQVTTKGPGLGLVLATCSNCGGVLQPDQGGFLKCVECGSRERRKNISRDYIRLKNPRRL